MGVRRCRRSAAFEFASGDGEYGCQGANYACYNLNHEPNRTRTDTPDEYIGFRYTLPDRS